LLKKIPAHNFAIYRLLSLKTDTLFASASRDKTIKLWDAEFRPLMRINQEQFNGHTHSVNALYWNEELNLLVSAGDDRRILAWKLEMD
jgi:WD40 repeat protein